MERPEPDPLWPDRLLFIGCGNMAGAILSRWLDCGLPPYRVRVVRPSGKPVARDVEVVTTRRIDVSSTEIRARLAAGKSVKGFVAESVERYIAAAKLYAADASHG